MIIKETRWWTRRMCTHLLLQELQNHNLILNNHPQDTVGSHEKKKKTNTHPRVKEKPQQDSRSVEIMLGIVNYKLALTKSIASNWTTMAFAHQDPEAPQRLSQSCLWGFECLLRRHESPVTCHGDRGSGCSRPGSHSLWQKPCWRRSPLAPLWSHRADNPQTAEQLRQINSPTVKKVLGPAIDFPTWGPSKGLRNPREFDFGGQWETEPTCLWLGVSCGFEPNNSEGTQTNPTGLD